MDKFLSTLSDYLKAAGQAISSYAPQAYQTTLDLIRVSAIVHTVELVVLWTVLCIVFCKSKDWIENSDLPERTGSDMDKRDLRGIRIFFGSAGAVSLSLITICGALDLVLGLFYPQLYLVYQIASKAGIL